MMAFIGAACTLLAVLMLMGLALILIAVMGLISLALLASTTSPEPELGADGRPVSRPAPGGLAPARAAEGASDARAGEQEASETPVRDAARKPARRDRVPGTPDVARSASEAPLLDGRPGARAREAAPPEAGESRVPPWPFAGPRSGWVPHGVAYARDAWLYPLRRYGETAQKLIGR
ncbi:hypothetical protein [Sphaerisporangium dianthi]|uniref:Uncharacterized protein n=1 Tax=Sphaerisporangium dianthi TaxID=1436120 RepID=A0ABV9CQJ1_9ACTN